MPFTTTYLGHAIQIEPFEWGYLAHILEPRSNTRLVAGSSSTFKALEDAFELIDDALEGNMPQRGSNPSTTANSKNAVSLA